MIAWLVDSWSLFWPSYLVAWFSAATLALVGIPVVAREQVLLGAGLVQAGTAGLALALACGLATGGHHGGVGTTVIAAIAIILAALVAGAPPGRERPEALAGWLFLAGSAGAVLLLAHQPMGLELLKQVQSSSLLGAGPFDPWVALALALVTLAGVVLGGRRLLLSAWEPGLAAALGQRTVLWQLAMAGWTGLCLASSLRLTGTLFTTALLVLPALIARRWCGGLTMLPWAAVLIAQAAVTGALAIAWHADLPPAQVAVALLAAALAATWALDAAGSAWRWWRNLAG